VQESAGVPGEEIQERLFSSLDDAEIARSLQLFLPSPRRRPLSVLLSHLSEKMDGYWKARCSEALHRRPGRREERRDEDVSRTMVRESRVDFIEDSDPFEFYENL